MLANICIYLLTYRALKIIYLQYLPPFLTTSWTDFSVSCHAAFTLSLSLLSPGAAITLLSLSSPSPCPLSGLAFLSVNQACPQQPLSFHLPTRPFISWHVGAESKGDVCLQLPHFITHLSFFLLSITITFYWICAKYGIIQTTAANNSARMY